MGVVALFGATGTIGSALARRLAGRGQPLLLIGRNADKLRGLAAELQQPHCQLASFDDPALEGRLREASEPQGGLQGVVNCVGSILLKPAHATSDEEFREVLETNLFSAFAAVRVGARLMRARGGSIVLFASAAAEVGIANHEAIAAAKAGVIGLARSAAATYAPSNIRVNAISLGLIRTELTRRIWENTATTAASTQLHALGRLGEPEHAASLAAWLLEPENDWITGQVLGVDGGLAHVLPRR